MAVAEARGSTLITNDLGDVCAVVRDGARQPLEPDDWGWLGGKGRNRPDRRRSLEQVRILPGFTVSVGEGRRIEPGPKPARPASFGSWPSGAAPAAAARSKGGVWGTYSMFDRLSDALGHVVETLPRAPGRSPFHVHDFVQGRTIVIAYDAPPPAPEGTGSVYLLDDGVGIKVGFTAAPLAVRISSLQTGNPRPPRAVAEIRPAGPDLERLLHGQFADCALQGEWFNRAAVIERKRRAGGWRSFLESLLPRGGWSISVHD